MNVYQLKFAGQTKALKYEVLSSWYNVQKLLIAKVYQL